MSRVILWVAGAIGLGLATPALAADNAMQTCGAKYQAAKTAKTLPAGQTWPQFLAQCRAALPKTAAATPMPAAAAAKPTPRASGTPTAAQLAERTRQKECGAQWKTDKAAGKIPAGQKWPQYWSACSKRLKG